MYKYLILLICIMTVQSKVHVYKIMYPNTYSTEELSRQSFFIRDSKYKTKTKKNPIGSIQISMVALVEI